MFLRWQEGMAPATSYNLIIITNTLFYKNIEEKVVKPCVLPSLIPFLAVKLTVWNCTLRDQSLSAITTPLTFSTKLFFC